MYLNLNISTRLTSLGASQQRFAHTVLTVQVGNAEDVKLAADGRGEGATDRGLTRNELADCRRACADGGAGGGAQEGGEGGDGELHCGCGSGSDVDGMRELVRSMVTGEV